MIQRRQIEFLVLLLCLVHCLSQGAVKVAEKASNASQTAGPDDFELGDEIPLGSGESLKPIKENPVSDHVTSGLAEEEIAASGKTTSIPLATETNVTSKANETNNNDATSAQADVEQDATTAKNASSDKSKQEKEVAAPVQEGPFVDLLGPQLLSLDMIDATHAQLVPHYTNEVLKDKKVVGLYFSADWCGPCRKFTPELVSFYNKINERRGKIGEFEIVWISRCRDVNSYGQYFAHMGKWFALPPEEAMGERGRLLGEKYKVKSIPSLVLLDDLGNVITRDARSKIPTDKAGIGFPWRNPIANLYITLFPRSVRLMIKSQVGVIKGKVFQRVKRILGLQRRA